MFGDAYEFTFPQYFRFPRKFFNFKIFLSILLWYINIISYIDRLVKLYYKIL